MTFGIFWPSLGRALFERRRSARRQSLYCPAAHIVVRGAPWARLFEKLPSGYRLTSAGHEVLRFAEQMEASSTSLENCVSGRDQGERGPLRVTMPPSIATYLLMPDLAEYAERHPEVELEVITGEATTPL